MYQWNEDSQQHANVFVNQLYSSIQRILDKDANLNKKLVYQKNWVDNFYNWDLRAAEWENMLRQLVS